MVLPDLLHLSLDHPARLLALLAPAAVALALGWRDRVRARRPRVAPDAPPASPRPWPLAGLLFASVLACLALAEPRLSFPPRGPRLIVLRDDRPGASDASKAAATRWAEDARRAGRFHDVRLRSFGHADASSAPDLGSAPALARALLAGAAEGDPRLRDVLVVWSDGRDLDPRAARVAAALRERGWSIFRGEETREPNQASSDALDVAVRALEGPASPPGRGSRFRVRVKLATTRPTRVHVRATQDDQPLPVPGLAPDGTLALAAGVSELPLSLEFPRARDRTRVRLTVEATGDSWPDNDTAEATFLATPSAAVWLVEAAPRSAGSEGARLASLLSKAGFEVRRLSPGGLGETWASAPAPGAVWLLDLAAGEIPARALGSLEEAVRAGVGLVVTGGAHAFAHGGYTASRLERLLPVLTDDSAPAEEATLALMLVLDRSGSMAGPKLELTKEGARAAARLLPEGSWLGIVAFDAQPIALVPLRPLGNRLQIESDLARLSASGGTNILAGLRAAVNDMRSVRARRKHIILLSDGQSPAEGVGLLVDGARDAGMTISTVAVGDGADQHLLRLIATRGGGRAYFTAEPTHLPQLFASETLTVRRPPPAPARPHLSLPTPHPVTAGLETQALPAPDEVARTRPRAQAEVLVASERAPLLACWSVALGRACTFTAAPFRDQGRGTNGSTPAASARLFTQLARYVARRASTDEGSLAVHLRGNVAELRWSPPDDAVVFDAQARFEGQPASDLLAAPRGESWRVTLRLPSPGPAQLVLEAVSSKGPVHVRRSLLVPGNGPASWLGEPQPAWWKITPIAPAASQLLAPRDVPAGAAAQKSAPPPRREWPSKTSILVAAAASVVASLWRWHRPRRPHGLADPRP